MMKYTISILLALLTICLVSCKDDEAVTPNQYGYVQFRVVKQQTRAAAIEKMADVAKIEVMLDHDGQQFNQTLMLSSYDEEAAEYGLQSTKLKLLTGSYRILGYYLYDVLDQKIGAGVPDDNGFEVVSDGLSSKVIAIDATLRGMVRIRMDKLLDMTRASSPAAYLFSDITKADIFVKELNTKEYVEIHGISLDYVEDYNKGGYETAHLESDSTVWIKAGNYEITGYVTYRGKKGGTMLETASLSGLGYTFSVKDNGVTDVTVPVRLSTTSQHIRDYQALREIWLAMDGPNWKYHGEVYTEGCNWDFNKDMDLWGDQPGVTTNASGRVNGLFIAGFGATGVVPDAIGQLDKLVILSLGTHDELINGRLFSVVDPAQLTTTHLSSVRHDYENRFLKRDVRSAMSPILTDAIERGDIPARAITKDARISLKDNSFGDITNHITGISRAMMRCTELQQFYLANAPIKADGFFRDIEPESEFYAERDQLSWKNLERLTDVELYNLPYLTQLPTELFDENGLPEIQLLNIACNKSIPADQLKSDLTVLCDGTSGPRLQILYMGYNNLEETPDHTHLQKLKKLALFDAINNNIRKIDYFGKEVNLNTIYLDNNKIAELPTDDEGYFFGYYDCETVSLANNQLTLVPDIFNAKSSYYIDQVDLSGNKITGFQNGDSFHGYNVTTLNLAKNLLTSFPKELFESGSPISSLNLMGNLISSFPEGAMTGSRSFTLQSIDLTYNKLKELPKDFYARNVPYLYGVDVSYNCFDAFPWTVLDGTRITVIGIRSQRDDKGNRTLREWPTGIYQSPSMRALYIGGNDLRKVEDTLSPYIYVLDIKDNPNISINVSDICYYIGAGSFMLMYDPTQDIRGCQYITKE